MSAAVTAVPLRPFGTAGVRADASANTCGPDPFDSIANDFWNRRYLRAPSLAGSRTVRGEYGQGRASDLQVTSLFHDAGDALRPLFRIPGSLGLFCIRLDEAGRVQVIDYPRPDVSATAPARDLEAETIFKAAFRKGEEERFEDGMESEFSKQLESLVRGYGPRSKNILTRLFEDESVSARVWGEAMRWLGQFDDPASREARLWVLEKGLTSRSAFVRDGAALGLASMDDQSAIPYLQRAIDLEKIVGLCADMQEVLSQLTRQ